MARKRHAIINAALAAFLDQGYGGSSVNRIAASAGVSITTLYRHSTGRRNCAPGSATHTGRSCLLLQAEIVDTALLGGPVPDTAAIRTRSHEAANDLLALAEAGRL
jgi:hypothetical protein